MRSLRSHAKEGEGLPSPRNDGKGEAEPAPQAASEPVGGPGNEEKGTAADGAAGDGGGEPSNDAAVPAGEAAGRDAPLQAPQSDRPRTMAITISPGRMGLALQLLDGVDGGGGARITRIDPSCAFGERVRVGDVLMTINGRTLKFVEDLAYCREESRRLEFTTVSIPAEKEEGLPAAGEAEPAPQSAAEPVTATGGPGEARDDKKGTVAEDGAVGDGGGGEPSDDAARGPSAGEAAGHDAPAAAAEEDQKEGTDPAPSASAAPASQVAPLLQEPERTMAITISPGRMGLTLQLLDGVDGGGGARITRIDPSCAFGERVRVGDVLMTINGRTLKFVEDFAYCRERPRRLEFRLAGSPGQGGGAAAGTGEKPLATASVVAQKKTAVGTNVVAPSWASDDPAIRDALHKQRFWQADKDDWWKVPIVGSKPVRPALDQEEWKKEVASALRSLGPDATDLERQRAGRGMPPGVAGPVHEPTTRKSFDTLNDAGAGGTDLTSSRRRELLLNEVLHFNKRANGDDANLSMARMGAHHYRVLLLPTKRPQAKGTKDVAENSKFFRRVNRNSGVFDRFLESWASYIEGGTDDAADMILHYMAGRFPHQYAGHAAVAEKKIEEASRLGAVPPGDELPPGFVSYDGTKDVKWNTLYAELVKYKAEHGHCRVPTKDNVLGNWVTRQRTAKNNPNVKNSHLNDTRMELLNGIGFVWCGLKEGSARAIPGGDPRMNRTMAAKVAFPDLALRECMLLGGYDDEELDKVKDQKHTVRGDTREYSSWKRSCPGRSQARKLNLIILSDAFSPRRRTLSPVEDLLRLPEGPHAHQAREVRHRPPDRRPDQDRGAREQAQGGRRGQDRGRVRREGVALRGVHVERRREEEGGDRPGRAGEVEEQEEEEGGGRRPPRRGRRRRGHGGGTGRERCRGSAGRYGGRGARQESQAGSGSRPTI